MAERTLNASRSALRRKRSQLRQLIGGLLAAATIASGAGCSTLNGLQKAISHSDCIDELLINHRNRAWASRAWYREETHHCNRQHLADFRAGFLAGYGGVADGGDGCTPAIAPSEYWGWKYQSAEGQGKVSAWFAGYPLGAAAAEQDGLGNWSQIRTNFPQQVELPPYQGDGSVPGPDGPIPVIPVGSKFAPTAADKTNSSGTPTETNPSFLDWSAVDLAAERQAAAAAP